MISRETLTLVTMHARNLGTFHGLHLAHRWFRLTARQQFMVRCRLRMLIGDHDVCYNILPHGHRDGICKVTSYKASITICVAYYVKGQRHGVFAKWYDRDHLRLQRTYAHDNMHGLSRIWYSSGQLMEQCTYVDGKRHGEHLQWYESGQLSHQCVYVNGKRHGKYFDWNQDAQLL